MKYILTAGIALAAFGASPAFAVNNTNCSRTADQLTGAQISTLLVSRYAQDVADKNNETLSGGTVTDYKLGPTDPKDPSSAVGTYTVLSATPGTITYKYPVSSPTATFTFYVSTLVQGASHSTIPASFLFCTSTATSGATVHTINVQTAHF